MTTASQEDPGPIRVWPLSALKLVGLGSVYVCVCVYVYESVCICVSVRMSVSECVCVGVNDCVRE